MRLKGSPAIESGRRIGGLHVLGLLCVYVLLYPLGYFSQAEGSPAAIWPVYALTFALLLLAPLRLWPVIALATFFVELTVLPVVTWATGWPPPMPWVSYFGFAAANCLSTLIPAGLCRGLRLFRREPAPSLTLSPLWIPVLFGGVLPGSLLGALTHAYTGRLALDPSDVGLWDVAAVLTLVTFGPAVVGAFAGFSEVARAPARPAEGVAVAALLFVLFLWLGIAPWPEADRLLEPMTFVIPLAWLALRFSRAATTIGVAAVASGVVVLTTHVGGTHDPRATGDLFIPVDLFLSIGCGGALVINWMTLKQRALLKTLAREHAHLQRYAQALVEAEEAARRVTAADLHDGVGQVLAGQHMLIGALRARVTQAPLIAMLEEIAAASREAQDGIRTMIQDLSPPEILNASLAETLRWLANLFEARYDFTVAWRITGSPEPDNPLRVLVYRSLRELLMNAYKHSLQRLAEVDIELSASTIHLTVSDEGIGFDARVGDLAGHDACARPGGQAPGGRYGLTQLRERINAAGGRLGIDAIPGEGCRVSIQLPALTPVPG